MYSNDSDVSAIKWQRSSIFGTMTWGAVSGVAAWLAFVALAPTRTKTI